MIEDELKEENFKDKRLYKFFAFQETYNSIPDSLLRSVSRKLDYIRAAKNIEDLRSPPGNRLEKLTPKQNNKYSIRVNEKYRIIFKYENNIFSEIELDSHSYNI